ncbi:MAG: hypothetical protein CMH27_05265 [Micavibrio sp.]|nr:hypothetical protein [Micavibrio sp.]
MILTRKKALKYTLLPEVFPRIGKLFGTGFFHVAFLIAQIFQSVRLLPRDHPYLNPQNMGRFGIRHVIAQAATNLQFKRGNIDQIIIFFTITAGLVLLVIQITLLAMAFFAQPVIAAGMASFAGWFTLNTGHAYYPYDETNDIALMLLDRIFGVQNIFNSCISTAAACIDHQGNNLTKAASYPYPMHSALHNLFYMYSIGISIMSLMVIVYFIMTIIGETAVTGTPFGQRFNRAWAPVRLILFFALLAPLNLGGGQNEGLNGAQLITLWTAKFGSNFATNAWGVFNTTTARTYYQPKQLIAIPSPPILTGMSQFFTLVNACIYAEKVINNRDIQWYIVRSQPPWNRFPGPPPPQFFTPPANTTPVAGMLDTVNFTGQVPAPTDILAWTNNGSPHVVIGEYDFNRHQKYNGRVKPICGSYTVPANTISEPGALEAFAAYWYTTIDFLPGGNFYPDIENLAKCNVNRSLSILDIPCDPSDPFPNYQDLIRDHLYFLQLRAQNSVEAAILQQVNTGDFTITNDLVGRGWAGAGIWFNRIAQMNGALSAAMFNTFTVKTYPLLMEKIKEQQTQNADTLTVGNMFNPALRDGRIVSLPGNQDHEMAAAYYTLYKIWDSNSQSISPETAPTGNPIMDTINAILGTNGLFNMREPATGPAAAVHDGNEEVHPLALMTSLGRSMVQASINNLGVAAGATLGGGLLSILQQFTGAAALLKTASSFLVTVATVAIMIGLMLGYILPLMPFIYFFFAISGWIKSIFEAMVAMPIWALAHIRIDGEGVVGPGATNGYFLLFEIFLRPILILIGMLASIMIFSAMVQVLNQIFDIMVNNVGGVDREDLTPANIAYYRGPIDELFYTVMYAAIVYMMGLSCFKLIDGIPNNIMRWMGVSVATFKENAGDPASQLAQTTYQRGNMMIGQVTGAFDNNAGRLAAMANA